ncbi:MAG: hypothetical protein LKG20_12425 [Tetrasphaera jenkinsii]|jgi:hypothetical protein|uniref:Uncharacterized protein n=1 Tax=Nostocoides jenkinsii Ben 74 TaxID=1193518 RepID=A0A077MF85_9MICO|nr:hypothetical protein [Tetrasphaera jenkinsii]MCI1263053.1 hypothetical protein [Tetrasphaera jenkinsii]CCI54695.1 conserved hypothetical protein [Tetrasphaera jenkinsii Ben 74]
MNTWTLTPAEYAATVAKVAAINKRAAKRGFTGRFELSGTTVTRKAENGVGEYVFVEATLTGEPPCYDGWTFLAAIDAVATDAGTEFLVRCAPGVDESLVDRSALREGACDHCGTKRNRRRVMLVTDGTTVNQVGATCIKDFLGWSTLPAFIDTESVRDGFGGLGGGTPSATVETVIAVAYAAVQRFGWGSTYSKTPTRMVVSDVLFGSRKKDAELRAELAPFIEQGERMAPAITETVLAHVVESGDSFEANLAVILRAEYVPDNGYGILCAAIPVYDRLVGTKKAETEPVVDAWIGTKGEKVTVTGRITTALTVDGYAYGSTQRLVVIETPAGVVKTYTAAAWAYDVDSGDEVTVTGVVKEHDTYRDRKQTVLVRPKRA